MIDDAAAATVNEAAFDAGVVREPSRWQALTRTAARYGVSGFGAMSIAAAHFIAAIVFLRMLPPAEFGLISFLFVATPPLMSVTMSLLYAPLVTTMYRDRAKAQAELATHLKANFCVALMVFALLSGLMFSCGAAPVPAVLFGAYGGLMSMRQFARCYMYVENRPFIVASSDVTYSGCLLLGLGVLYAAHQFNESAIAITLAVAVVAAILPFGREYLTRQFTSGMFGWAKEYAVFWRDTSRWSLLGVVSTEITANAHAYLVTLIFGSHAFALLAAGALFMRPVSLVLTALPEMERPAMARGIIAGDRKAAFRPVKIFRLIIAGAWALTMLATAAVLIWFPSLVLKSHYPVADVAVVVALWAAIMLVRVVRTPDGVFLQAATEFRALAWASVGSAVVSLILTLALLILWGPMASLAGILAGEIVMMIRIRMLIADWKGRHA